MSHETPVVTDAVTHQNHPLTHDQLVATIWQNHVLAAMGVTQWISQASPVITVSDEHWQSIIDSEPLAYDTSFLASNVPTPMPVDPTLQTSNEPVQDVETDNVLSLVDEDEQVVLGAVMPLATLDTEVTSIPSQRTIATVSTYDDEAVQRFSLQAAYLGDWILLVDSESLQQDMRQAQLWSQVLQNLRLKTAYFDFPFCDEHETIPASAMQVMCHSRMAVAGFAGFTYKLNQGNAAKLGALTPLPPCLDSVMIERLPYLSEMVEDYRLKRQLWRLLSGD